MVLLFQSLQNQLTFCYLLRKVHGVDFEKVLFVCVWGCVWVWMEGRGKDLNAFHLTFLVEVVVAASRQQRRDSIWIRFGYLATLPKTLIYNFTIKLAMKRKQPPPPPNSPLRTLT